MSESIYIKLPNGQEHTIAGRTAQWITEFVANEKNAFVRIEAIAVSVKQIERYCELKRAMLLNELIAMLKHPALTVRETGELLKDYQAADIAFILQLDKPMSIKKLITHLSKASIFEINNIMLLVENLLYISES